MPKLDHKILCGWLFKTFRVSKGQMRAHSSGNNTSCINIIIWCAVVRYMQLSNEWRRRTTSLSILPPCVYDTRFCLRRNKKDVHVLFVTYDKLTHPINSRCVVLVFLYICFLEKRSKPLKDCFTIWNQLVQIIIQEWCVAATLFVQGIEEHTAQCIVGLLCILFTYYFVFMPH